MGFSFEKELQHSINRINRLIEEINRAGGQVHLCLRDYKDFSIHLKEPINIVYFRPISIERTGWNIEAMPEEG